MLALDPRASPFPSSQDVSSCARPGRSHLNSSSSPSVASAPAGSRGSGRRGVPGRSVIWRAVRELPGAHAPRRPSSAGSGSATPVPGGRRLRRSGRSRAVCARPAPGLRSSAKCGPCPSIAPLPRRRSHARALPLASSPRDGTSPEEHRRTRKAKLARSPRRGGRVAPEPSQALGARARGGRGGRGARCSRRRRPVPACAGTRLCRPRAGARAGGEGSPPPPAPI